MKLRQIHAKSRPLFTHDAARSATGGRDRGPAAAGGGAGGRRGSPAQGRRVRLTADASDELIFESKEVEFSPNTRTTIVVNDNVGPDPDSLSVWLVRDNSTASQRNRFAKSGFRV